MGKEVCRTLRTGNRERALHHNEELVEPYPQEPGIAIAGFGNERSPSDGPFCLTSRMMQRLEKSIVRVRNYPINTLHRVLRFSTTCI